MRNYDEGGRSGGRTAVNTPIADFVRRYEEGKSIRFHMPGHKGKIWMGCEPWDITEIRGADSLYEADGIIAESEHNAAELFGAARTFYSTEGSSQCIRAMLAMAVWSFSLENPDKRPAVVAGRNIHKSFLYAAGMLDFDIIWLWPASAYSICACNITADQLEATLKSLPCPPAAVYITTPDYLGGSCDVASLAKVAHQYDTLLIVDNAHGAYLRFLDQSRHPLDLGADLVCDSAHKTLPVLTGGAYLHVSSLAPAYFVENGKRALAVFGSTSPSYLILQSLDLCNQVLSRGYVEHLQKTAVALEGIRQQLRRNGWKVADTDPLKLTIDCAESGQNGVELAQRLEGNGIVCEYYDVDDLVFMITPGNSAGELDQLAEQLGVNTASPRCRPPLLSRAGEAVVSVREGLWMAHRSIPADEAAGFICGAPTVSCPPAIPVAVTGERITAETVRLFQHYGIKTVEVLCL